ncbi:hypothetical protein BGX26_011983 [Mortierella sp. AD094]|nr:hypothetical protein BGX26_011983 [Mortierella sp. AD094]
MSSWNEGTNEYQTSFANALEAFLDLKANRPSSSATSRRPVSNASRQVEDSSFMEIDTEEDWRQDEDMESEDFGRSNPGSDDDHDIAEADFLSKEERDRFFDTVLPKMQALALQLPELVKKPIPLLKQQQDSAITLSQEQEFGGAASIQQY